MICNKCGENNRENSEFCVNCGTKLESIHITKSQIQKEETVLKIFNCFTFLILFLTYFYYIFCWIILAFACILGGTSCIDATNNPSNHDFKSIIEGKWFIPLLIFCLILIILILVVNIILIIKMKKNNKLNQTNGQFYVSKIAYIITALLMGSYGVHRFIANDKKMALIHILLTLGIPFVMFLLAEIFSNSILSIGFITFSFITLIISYSLAFSDAIIGISKMRDKNGKIYI